MKKYLLSFVLVVAFAFYVMLDNQSSVNVGPAANVPAVQTPAPSPAQTPVAQTPPVQTPAPTTQAPAPTPTPTPTPAPTQTAGAYKNGAYTGSVADAYFGNVQVKAIIQSGKLSDVQILQYPSDRGTSREINANAMPQLVQEAIQAQGPTVNIVSGATQSSEAFQQSLASALGQAKT